MSREVHVRFCERLGHLSPADSTDDINSSEVCGVAGGGISKEKVRYIWRECIWARSEILWVRVFGLVGIMFQR